MIKYECFMCDRELHKSTTKGWFYCSDCDVDYSKTILTPVHELDRDSEEVVASWTAQFGEKK